MENLDKEKIERIVKTRKQANAYFTKRSKVFRTFCELEDQTYEAGALSVKEKRLIAIGIAVAIIAFLVVNVNAESYVYRVANGLGEGRKALPAPTFEESKREDPSK